METKKRNTAFEVMRIISMLMVCAFHWQLHGYNDSISNSKLCLNQVVSFIFGSWGILGVDLFFLLSFYFLIQRNEVNYKKIIDLIIKVSVFGTTIFLIGISTGATNFDLVELVKSLLGIFAYQYWFISIYIIIVILSPLLNRLLCTMSKKESGILLGIMFYVTYILSWIIGNEIVGRLACGVTLYILIYVLENKISRNFFEIYRYLAIPAIILGIVAEIFLSFLGTNYNPLFYKVIGKLQTTASPYMLVVAILVFYVFKNLKMKNNNVIIFLGKYSSGAYLLHGGASFIKGYLWDGVFEVEKYYQLSVLKYIFHYIICILVLFVIGAICDYIYSNTIGCAVNKVLNNLKNTKK